MFGRWMAAIALAVSLIGIPAVCLAQPAPAAVTAPAGNGAPRIEDFTRDPDMSPPQISPDGKWLAWVRGGDVVVYDIAADKLKVETSAAGTPLESVEWINNDYFVVNLKGDKVHKGNMVTVTAFSPMVMRRDGSFVRVLFAQGKRPVAMDDILPIWRFVDGPAPYVVSVDGDRLVMIDVATGNRKNGPELMDGDLHYFDRQGHEHLSVEIKDAQDIKANYGFLRLYLHYRVAPDGGAQDLVLPKQDHVYYLNVHYAEAEHAIYWTQFDDSLGQLAVWRLDMATGARTLVRISDDRTLDVVIDDSGRLAGFSVVKARAETEWTDPARVRVIAAVQKIFPKATVDIADMTDDGKVVVFLISAPEAPDSYYLYDATAHTLDEIGTDYPELADQPLGEMTYITYKARDGLDIPAYVIKRKDTPAGAPLVVMPHGGPASRDVYGFDYMAEYLAAKGYVVLQPQYRGSDGFGDAFQHAGDRHLAEMTTDLEDGVRYLAAQGTIDPKKVCIFGWSWGGYLAQAALAFTPKTYVCGVSGDGISDLYASLGESDWWGGFGAPYWRNLIGRPMADAAMIHATSPIEHVDAIQAPLLLIHGSEDTVVIPRQSARMNAVMLKAGKKVTYLPIPYMHHGPEKAAERLEVMKAVDAFIADAFAKAGTAPAGK